MRYLTFLFFTLLVQVNSASAQCEFKYWELIPSSSSCAKFKLPDFEFQQIEQPEDAPAHIKRFCKLFLVHSSSGEQKVGYCYTGEGDRSGPSFNIQFKNYIADLNFVGCIDGKRSEGIMFLPESWSSAPKNIKRLWPVESPGSKVTCTP